MASVPDLFYVPFPVDLGPVLFDGVEPVTDREGTQRTTPSGTPLWRVFVWVRLPAEDRRRVLPVQVASVVAPHAAPDEPVRLEGLTVSTWRLRESGRCGVRLAAEAVVPWSN